MSPNVTKTSSGDPGYESLNAWGDFPQVLPSPEDNKSGLKKNSAAAKVNSDTNTSNDQFGSFIRDIMGKGNTNDTTAVDGKSPTSISGSGSYTSAIGNFAKYGSGYSLNNSSTANNTLNSTITATSGNTSDSFNGGLGSVNSSSTKGANSSNSPVNTGSGKGYQNTRGSGKGSTSNFPGYNNSSPNSPTNSGSKYNSGKGNKFNRSSISSNNSSENNHTNGKNSYNLTNTFTTTDNVNNLNFTTNHFSATNSVSQAAVNHANVAAAAQAAAAVAQQAQAQAQALTGGSNNPYSNTKSNGYQNNFGGSVQLPGHDLISGNLAAAAAIQQQQQQIMLLSQLGGSGLLSQVLQVQQQLQQIQHAAFLSGAADGSKAVSYQMSNGVTEGGSPTNLLYGSPVDHGSMLGASPTDPNHLVTNLLAPQTTALSASQANPAAITTSQWQNLDFNKLNSIPDFVPSSQSHSISAAQATINDNTLASVPAAPGLEMPTSLAKSEYTSKGKGKGDYYKDHTSNRFSISSSSTIASSGNTWNSLPSSSSSSSASGADDTPVLNLNDVDVLNNHTSSTSPINNLSSNDNISRLSVNPNQTKRDRFVVKCLETGTEEEVITSQKYLATLRVGIPHSHPFGVAKRIIGPSGRNMKIVAGLVRGAKIRLRGEGFQDKDSHQPLQLNVSSHSVEGYIIAKYLLLKLLKQIHQNLRDWRESSSNTFTNAAQKNGQTDINSPEMLALEGITELRISEHPMNPSFTPEFENDFLDKVRSTCIDGVYFTTSIAHTSLITKTDEGEVVGSGHNGYHGARNSFNNLNNVDTVQSVAEPKSGVSTTLNSSPINGNFNDFLSKILNPTSDDSASSIIGQVETTAENSSNEGVEGTSLQCQ